MKYWRDGNLSVLAASLLLERKPVGPRTPATLHQSSTAREVQGKPAILQTASVGSRVPPGFTQGQDSNWQVVRRAPPRPRAHTGQCAD